MIRNDNLLVYCGKITILMKLKWNSLDDSFHSKSALCEKFFGKLQIQKKGDNELIC